MAINLNNVTQQLRDERSKVQSVLDRIDRAIIALSSGGNSSFVATHSTNGKRTLSAEARRKMSLAQKARWAKYRQTATKK